MLELIARDRYLDLARTIMSCRVDSLHGRLVRGRFVCMCWVLLDWLCLCLLVRIWRGRRIGLFQPRGQCMFERVRRNAHLSGGRNVALRRVRRRVCVLGNWCGKAGSREGEDGEDG